MAANLTTGTARPVSCRVPGWDNFDASGLAVVRSGCTVSHGGFRLLVTRVSRGALTGRHLNAWGQLTQDVEVLPCRQVRVVTP